MAEITFGMGLSHGPLLILEPEEWGRSKTADMMDIKIVDWRGKKYDIEDLRKMREDDYLRNEVTVESWTAKKKRCTDALAELKKRLNDAKPDVMIIFGDDHFEYFKRDVQPSIGIFTGDSVTATGFNPETDWQDKPEAVRRIFASHNPPEDQEFPVPQELALGIVKEANAADFDMTVSMENPVDANGMRSLGHAFGFVYRQLLDDVPVPMVPVLLNTYFPPNQPSVKKCFEMGRAVARAVKAWDEDKKVCVVGSGGISHFAIDEEWDQMVIKALKERDLDTIMAQSEALFESGTSEVKNWIACLGALWETDFEMDLIDYVPCYRSTAGTGTAQGFATWS